MKKTLNTLLVTSLLTAGLMSNAAWADSFSACINKKNGQWRVATGKRLCKSKTEKVVQFNTFTTAGNEMIVRSAGTDVGPENPTVVDANGQFLGYLADSTVLTVYLPDLKVRARIETDPTNPNYGNVSEVKQDTTVFYPNKDCTGTPIFGVLYQTPQLVHVSGDNTYRLATAKKNITHTTGYFVDKTKTPAVCTPFEGWLTTKPTYDLSDPVTLPFSAPVIFPLSYK